MGNTRINKIKIIGANEHNLKKVSLTLPHDQLIVCTGVSGSGKSSLAFDTICKEGQRRYIESLPAYARQFIGTLEKPDVELIDGLLPTVSIDQKVRGRSPRSTVGTITELYDFLRLLFARLGKPYCPDCNIPVETLSTDQICDRILSGKDHAQSVQMVLAPMVRMRKGEYRREISDWISKGYVRAVIDNQLVRLEEAPQLQRYERHSIDLVIDRLKITPENRARLSEAIEKALDAANLVKVGQQTFSSSRACPNCGHPIAELEPRLFSFNDPQGACPTCTGLGYIQQFDEQRLMFQQRSLADEALSGTNKDGRIYFTCISHQYLLDICDDLGISTSTPWQDLPQKQRQLLLEGNYKGEVTGRHLFTRPKLLQNMAAKGSWPGLYKIYEFLARFSSRLIDRFRNSMPCPSCDGLRLSKTALAVRFHDRNIDDFSKLNIGTIYDFFSSLNLSEREQIIGKDILRQIKLRSGYLQQVGVGYLTLERNANTLSGGEFQRVRLAVQVGTGLRGVLYVLDEPSIGLHQSDNLKLIQTLKQLRDLGNTVIVVEHDAQTMLSADYIVDLGPGAGADGGQILAMGTPRALLKNKASISGRYLSGGLKLDLPITRRSAEHWINLKGCNAHNIVDQDFKIPLQTLCVITGVSGSGKSTFVERILSAAVRTQLEKLPLPAVCKQQQGCEQLDKIIEIDQSPIGRTPRSNAATYTKVFDLIRNLYAQLPQSKLRAYKAGRFSFNVKGGRCEECQGAGVKLIEMQFMGNVAIECDVCLGKRFNNETLEICYQDYNIADILNLSVNEACSVFKNQPQIAHILKTLQKVGLGYLLLGQPSTQLSGGEAQRVKLASELRRQATGRTLYIMDEPTTGLHIHDINYLMTSIQSLVNAGNSVVVIEHNTDVISCADYVIDMGPGGGDAGGKIVFSGQYQKFIECNQSLTSTTLREGLAFEPQSKRTKKSALIDEDIIIRGARQNNLAGIDVRIPRNKLSVITGVSGSGKTSLALDTLFAEGQSRYVESLSTYARRFLGRMTKAKVDSIDGLMPAIAVQQQQSSGTQRSTVATSTELYDFLRLIYTSIGQPHCLNCQAPLHAAAPSRLAKQLLEKYHGQRRVVLAPLVPLSASASKTTAAALKQRLNELFERGFARFYSKNGFFDLHDGYPKRIPKPLYAVIDRISIAEKSGKRLTEALESAYRESLLSTLGIMDDDGSIELFSEQTGCAKCEYFLPEPFVPRDFSFNTHHGACPECNGLGATLQLDEDLLIIDRSKPLFGGGMATSRGARYLGGQPGLGRKYLQAFAKRADIPIKKAVNKLSQADLHALLYKGDRSYSGGVYGLAMQWLKKSDDPEHWGQCMMDVLRHAACPMCHGQRLKPEVLNVSILGKNIAQFCTMRADEALAWVEGWQLRPHQTQIIAQPLDEVKSLLSFLIKVGVEYLNLDRRSNTLSGGEAQRIRLATQLGSNLTGILYVLDEPTIGLHPHNINKLAGTLEMLRDRGNTVVLVEHDAEIISRADHIIEIGPLAGHRGGQLVQSCSPANLMRRQSLTGQYLSHKLSVHPAKGLPALANPDYITIKGARHNNLQNITAKFPLNALTTVSGLSGSGKSSLVIDTLQKALQRHLHNSNQPIGEHDSITGFESLKKIVVVEQSPIGRSPKSNAATYTGLIVPLRNLMAQQPEARKRGYAAKRFSFNLKGGRCEACSGYGYEHVEMHFLADLWLPCDVCHGQRFNRETLEVTFKGHNMASILGMEVDEALQLFENQPAIHRFLTVLHSVGLGYLKLDQSATTLSGGEAQRIKLATELSKRNHGSTLYILDEPSIGLHMDDIAKLIKVLYDLVKTGNTVIVVEHNLDFIHAAQHIIDMGPEGGNAGGKIIAEGSPHLVAKLDYSYTGVHYRHYLNQRTANE